MASDGTELSNSLVAVRGWLLATIPEACGLSHDTTILADYTLALLTSIEGTEDQIRAHCLQELEQFFPPETLLDFFDSLLDRVHTSNSAAEILCLSDPQLVDKSCRSLEPAEHCRPRSDAAETPLNRVLTTSKIDLPPQIQRDQEYFEQKAQARLLLSQRRQEIAPRITELEQHIQQLRQILARSGN